MAGIEERELTTDEVQTRLDELARRIERLRVKYEQYFLGIDRIPPSVLRTQVVRLMRAMENLQLRNTALKFRLRSLVQKFHTYSTYWNRTMREIENGTYRRHKLRAQRRTERREQSSRQHRRRENQEAEEDEEARERREQQAKEVGDAADDFLKSLEGGKGIDIDFNEFDEGFDTTFGSRPESGLKHAGDAFGSEPTPRRSRAPTSSVHTDVTAIGRAPSRPAQREAPKAPPRRSRQGPLSPGGPPRPGQKRSTSAPPPGKRAKPLPGARSGQQPRGSGARSGSKRLYDEFVAVRERLGQNRKPLSYDKFERSVKAQKERVKKSHKCREVDFKVVVKNGKPYLKPIPK